MKIRIGTRKSPLAVKQAEAAAEALKKAFPEDEFEIVKISTEGDKRLDRTLESFGGKGVFIKELENALLKGEIDIAVHSAKDMPTELPDGLEIGAALPRGAHEDVLVSLSDKPVKVIGTGSARRSAQARELYPDALIKPVRGNIGTRINKLKSGEYDALIMAKAALDRLDLGEGLIITPLNFVCAAGQGIIALETRGGDLKKYTDAVNHAPTMAALQAERAFLKESGGGCHSPAGAHAVLKDGKIIMETLSVKNGKIIRETKILQGV